MARRTIQDESGREISLDHDRPVGRGKPYRFSWSALFAGAIAALGVWILLYALGAALGLSTADPNTAGGMRGPGIFTGAFAIIAPIIALFIGGLVASRTAGAITKMGGGLHGLVMWSLTAVAGVWLVANLFGSVLGSAVAVSGQVASGVAAEQGAGGIAGTVEEQLSRAQAQGAEVGQGAAEALPEAGGAMWIAFGSLALGLIAAVIGGVIGVTREQRLAAEHLAVGVPAGAYPGISPVATRPALSPERGVAYGEEGRQGVPPGVPLPTGAAHQEHPPRIERRRAEDGRLDDLQREVAGLRADVRQALGRERPGMPH